jgi:hypothetical protein
VRCSYFKNDDGPMKNVFEHPGSLFVTHSSFTFEIEGHIFYFGIYKLLELLSC